MPPRTDAWSDQRLTVVEAQAHYQEALRELEASKRADVRRIIGPICLSAKPMVTVMRSPDRQGELDCDNGCAESVIRARLASSRPGPGSERRRSVGTSQAQLLVEIAAEATLFHDGGDAYAVVPVNGHHETWALKSSGARDWLLGRFYAQHGESASPQAMQEALGILGAKARFEGPQWPVRLRIAEYGGAIYLDLCNDAWEAVEITGEGWHVVAEPPVRFRRTAGMLALPTPVRGGAVDALRPFVNVGNEHDWRLLISWVVMAYCPRGPYAVLILNGRQGSAKSTTARVIQRPIDPSMADLRAEPRDVQGLMVGAKNGWVLAFDNLSNVRPWLSDALCRVSTGGSISNRRLYTDDQEAIIKAQRPVILTGITELATRGDLLDRALLISPPEIGGRRREEREFWTEFERVRAGILGALLDGVSAAIRNLPSTTVANKPRMADFAMWSVAASPGLGWSADEFLTAYERNRAGAHLVALEAAPIGAAVMRFLRERRGYWQGTPTSLLEALDKKRDERASWGWPATPAALSGALERLARSLEAVEIIVERPNRTSQHRLIVLRWKEGGQAERHDAHDDSGEGSVIPKFPWEKGNDDDDADDDPSLEE